MLAGSASLSQTATPSEITVGAITSSQALRDGIEIQAGSAMLRITALRDDIVRVRISPGAFPEDASWAVLSGARSKSIDVKPTQDDASVGFHTATLDARAERNPLRFVIRHLAGNTISANAFGPPTR